jgi:urocanate hydratase
MDCLGKEFLPDIRRAPKRSNTLSESQKVLAVANALRYIPKEFHSELLDEFIDELNEVGRIYGYRFRPQGPLVGNPLTSTKVNVWKVKPFKS